MNGDTAPVPASGGFDLTLRFTEAVVHDLASRQLQDPLTRDPHAPAFLPRRILKNEAQRQAPFALEWGLPRLSCAEDGLLAAVIPLRGGVRPPALTRNLTLRVSATVRAPLRVARDPKGTPYPAIDTSAAQALELGDARVGDALAELPAPAPPLDLGAVLGLLRPALAPALLESLSRVRLAYALESLPLRLHGAPQALGPQENHREQREQAEWVFAARRADAWVIASGEEKALALGVMLAGGAGSAVGEVGNLGNLGDLAPKRAPIPVLPGIPKTPTSNMALTLSNAGMKSLLAQLEAAGLLRGRALPHGASQPVAWAWEGLTCAFEEGVVAVAGRLSAGARVDDVRLLLTCALDQRGELVITYVGGMTNPHLNELATASFRALLRRLFCATGAHEGEARLWQRFTIPGTRVKVEAPAVALLLAHDALTLLYQAPLTPRAPSLPDVQADPLTVTLSQRDLPEQMAPGTPVTAELEATLSEAIPPVELAWSAKPPAMISAAPDTLHNTRALVTSVPSGVSGDGAAHPLAEVTVRAADLLGRTATAATTARYRATSQQRQSELPQTTPRVRAPRSLLRFILPAMLIIALLAGGGALATVFLRPAPGLPPVIKISPSTTYQQTCISASPTLSPTAVTLDNTGSSLAIAWSARVQGAEPGRPSEVWASLDGGGATTSGVIGGGHTHTLTMTPAPDLCDALFSASGQHVFTVMITYRLASQSSRETGAPAAAGVAAGAASLSAGSRAITLTDAIFAVRFSAYVESKDQSTLEIAQACDGLSAPPPSSFSIILDNSRSDAPVNWQTSAVESLSPRTPTPQATEPWATIDVASGFLPPGPGARATVVVTPSGDVCSTIPVTLPPTAVDFHALVTYSASSSGADAAFTTTTITDTITGYPTQIQ